jgi:virginiamycin A acetyltransferase
MLARIKKAVKILINYDSKKNTIVTPPNPEHILKYEVMHNSILNGKNSIGDETYIGFNCFITSSTIGRYCSIANNVSIGVGEHRIYRVSTSSLFYKNPFEKLTEQDCIIGNDVWIGSNAVIRRGVKIGNGAVIGANSFVNKDVGDFEIVAGSPAKLIKKRFDEKTIKIINDSNWWNLDFSDANAKIKELEKLGIFEVDAN